jgi:hypothetical protein
LTALALTHSALHNLAIPHIYSRFDIVWPDAHATTDPRTGVDALTYGLATLCMGDVFTEHEHGQSYICTNCGASNTAHCNHGLNLGLRKGQRRLGNQYPQFTRKFSLGNGPADWVQEYLITKESGKMLGTLVALAVARMVNLETFVWDMPTGVLRDVWLALSSLQTRNAKEECRLERVWVRWHDNSEATHIPPAQTSNTTSTSPATSNTMTSIGLLIPPGSISATSGQASTLSYSQSRVEYPTLSVLPPLKSLSVLDIDELDYLDEMSVLIAKSKGRLRELRVGISAKAVSRDFAMAWDGPDLHQIDHKAAWPGASTIGDRRLGGVLGVLLGRVFDIRKKQKTKTEKKQPEDVVATSTTFQHTTAPQMESHVITPMDIQSDQLIQEYTSQAAGTLGGDKWISKQSLISTEGILFTPGIAFNIHGGSPSNVSDVTESNQDITSHLTGVEPDLADEGSLGALISATEIVAEVNGHSNAAVALESTVELPLRRTQAQNQMQSHFSEGPSSERERLEGKLRLQTLELERIPLSVAVLQKAFDWSVLTNLTILDCAQHDRLWIMLRRHFQPSPLGLSHSSVKHGAASSVQYHLNLKKIHTDAASPALISFLKETLAPNSLETLFLQDRRRSSNANVTIVRVTLGFTFHC